MKTMFLLMMLVTVGCSTKSTSSNAAANSVYGMDPNEFNIPDGWKPGDMPPPRRAHNSSITITVNK